MKAWGKIGIIVAILFAAFITIGIYSNSEVVSAFGKINQKLEEANKKSQSDNDAIIHAIQNDSLLAKSIRLKETTLAFNEYVERLKVSLLNSVGGDFEKADKETNLFFETSQITEEGERFLVALEVVRLWLIKNTTADDTLLRKRIDDLYESVDDQGKGESWLRYHFEGFPIISVIATLTSIQNDILAIEKQILVGFLDQEKHNTQ